MTTTTLAKAVTDTDLCKHCDRPMWRKGTPLEDRPEGSILHSGHGACTACYHRLYTVGGLTVEKKVQPSVPQPRRGMQPLDTSWHPEGACTKEDPELFYHPPEERAGTKEARTKAAKEICQGCPVKMLCREQARTNREPYGVWGGESEDERTAWLRRQQRGRKKATA